MTDSAYTVDMLDPCNPLDGWDVFVDESPQGSIFCRSWWLRAVCGDQFKVLLVHKAGRIVAGMPLPVRRRFGRTVVVMPQLTQTLGVLLAPSAKTTYGAILSEQMNILNALVEAVPKVDYFSMNFHFAFTNWLPFCWAGFSQTTRYTYVLDDMSDTRVLYDNLSPQIRNKIRKAKKEGIVVFETDDIETLLDLNEKTFARQGLGVPYRRDLVRSIDKECRIRDCRRIFLTKDSAGRAHSALYVVYDGKSMYNLIQGGDAQLRESGANPLAMWHSIEFAHEVTKRYDFEGSMMPNVEPFFRSFGGLQMPYFNVTKSTLPGVVRLCLGVPRLRAVLGRVAGAR